MFSRIFLDIRLQLRRAHNLDIICKSAIEPTYSCIVIHSGLQYPVGTFPGDVLGGKRVFLQQKALRPQAEAQLDGLRRFSGHTEHIGALATMAAFELPIVVQDFNFANAGNLEDLVMQVFEVIGPDINEIGREGEWFNESVLHGFASG